MQGDYSLYLKGRNKGLDKFCDVSNAFDFALKGLHYKGQCKGRANEQQFKVEWQRGYDQFMYQK